MGFVLTSDFLPVWILALPLLSFVVSLCITKRYAWAVSFIAPFCLFISASLSVFVFFTAPDVSLHTTWLVLGDIDLSVGIQLSALSRLMLVIVTVVSFMAHVYSIGYMAGDLRIRQYFAMLGFFTFTMLALVLADNLLLLFVFWELVGFASYLLIAHWYEKPAAAQAAKKAFLFNRIGDAAFLVGIMLVWANTQTLSIDSFALAEGTSSWQTAAGICIFCGVIGKSAQLPLFSWLPDAMEGPTPVSALLHAATMVAAGIFVLIRLFPFFTEGALIVITLTGILTALFAAVCALHQFDLKKILAYSTISQLGLMVTAVGVGAEDAALLHLFTHAFFKAALFLAAGAVIHSMLHHQQQTKEQIDVQDIRNLGGLRKSMPVTFLVFCMSGASLAGIPLFSGFLSKDSIFTAAFAWTNEPFSWKWLVVIVLFVVSFLTVLYTFRMIWFTFFQKKNPVDVRESPVIMQLPMVVLACASLWLLISNNPVYVSGWFANSFMGIEHNSLISGISTGWIVLSLCFAYLFYSKKTIPTAIPAFTSGLNIDTLYEKSIGSLVIGLSKQSIIIDRKWIDGALHLIAYMHVGFARIIAWLDTNVIDGTVNLMARIAGWVGSFTRSFQGGKIQRYIFWAVIALIISLFFALI